MEKVFTIHVPKITENNAVYTYSYTDGISNFSFQEEHLFPFAIQDSKALRALAIATSISYFKLHLAPQIHIAWHLSDFEKEFWQWLFRNGFSELVYQNKLSWDILDRIHIGFDKEEVPNETPTQYQSKAIVGIGGGKDSSLAVELLKKMDVQVAGFAIKVRAIPLLKENTQALSVPLFEVVRITDPQLLTLKENVYLGHVPISLVYAFTGVVLAQNQKSKYVVVANETSADESNTTWLERPVNHQWSKTTEFEKKIQDFIHETITPEITYFSILRPLGGLRVTKLFTKLCPHVFTSFSSCNKNFTIEESGTKRWCGTCAKCLGTNILLSPSLSLTERVRIFGADLFQNESLSPLLKELLGLSPVKPFDCVATRAEMCRAVTKCDDFKNTPLGKTISEEEWLIVETHAKNAESFLNTYHHHFIPDEINTPLRAIIELCE